MIQFVKRINRFGGVFFPFDNVELHMQKTRIMVIVLAIHVFAMLTPLSAVTASNTVETRLYRKSADRQEYINSYHIEKHERGLFVRIFSTLDKQIHLKKELWLDQNYATLKWKYRDMKDGIDVFAQRVHNTIYIKGVSRGKTINKRYTIDELPWKQQFPFDLEAFIRSEEKKLMFWSIGVNGPADMKVAKLVATKKEYGVLYINGEETKAIRVSIRFAGLLSPIWHGTAWYRADDGRFIYFTSSSAPGHTPMELEIIGNV
jgi:hypothetical protein